MSGTWQIARAPYPNGLVAFVAFCIHEPAVAQGVDSDYWKQAAVRQDTVNRFFYGQSPHAIPSSYDPVREAEQILRQQQRTLPTCNPRSSPLWQQIRGITVKSALSTAPRALGTVGLVVGVFEVGWRIGSGINAKFLKIGVP